jgi:hypothetical protein
MFLEDHEKDEIANALFKKIINHSSDLAAAHLQNTRTPKTQRLYKTTHVGQVSGHFSLYLDNRMYLFYAHPASALYQTTPRNALLLPDSEHPIDAEFFLTPEMAELTATKLLERPR